MPAGSVTRFLNLQNAAGTRAHYFGVDVTPAEPQDSLTVAVTGETACAPNAVRRCFEVDGVGAATLTFHYTEAERAGLDASALQVWRWNAAAQEWEVAGTVTGGAAAGPDYALTVADVALGARFVLCAGNAAPWADDDAFTATEDGSAITLDVLAGDTDADGDALRIVSVGTPDRGGAVVIAGATLVYTPTADFFGVESFTYVVGDAFGGRATGTVQVTVNAANDAPTADAGSDQTVQVGESVTLDGAASTDPDGDSLAYWWTQPGGAAVSFTPTLSRTTFVTPDAPGVLTFTLAVTDTGGLSAQADVRVTVVAHPLYNTYLPLVMQQN